MRSQVRRWTRPEETDYLQLRGYQARSYVTQASRPGKKKKRKERSCVISACQLDSSSPNHIYAVIGHAWHFQGWPISDADCNEIRELAELHAFCSRSCGPFLSHLPTKWGPRGRFHHQNQKTLLFRSANQNTYSSAWVKVCRSTYF